MLDREPSNIISTGSYDRITVQGIGEVSSDHRLIRSLFDISTGQWNAIRELYLLIAAAAFIHISLLLYISFFLFISLYILVIMKYS